MPKQISANLLTSVRSLVTTMAICVEIRRRDGRVYRLTNHDQDIVFDEKTFRHDIPFTNAALSSGSQFQVSNTEIVLFIDEDVFRRADFKNGVFDHADCTIFMLDYEHPEYGPLRMTRGWFGPIDHNQHQVVKITVVGLLKILDFEIGRVYQPSCDADLGDKRCKVAINPGQIYSPLNPYYIGQWVYRYDPALMNELPIVNGSFEADGARSVNQAITGWNKGPGTQVVVKNSDASLNPYSGDGGSYSLYGHDAAGSELGQDHYVWQDIDLVAAGIDAADIDDGQISVAFFAVLAQTVYFLDPVRIRLEGLNDAGEILAFEDSFYRAGPRDDVFNAFNVWRELGLVIPLLPGVRYVRVFVYFRKDDGVSVNGAADIARAYWWNHTEGSPYSDVIHRATRIIANNEGTAYFPVNGSFEANGAVVNALSPTINGWVTSGSWWRVNNNLSSLPVIDGAQYLIGGNDGSGVQKTYTITKTFSLVSDAKLDQTQLDFGRLVAIFRMVVGFGDISASAATVYFDILDGANTILSTRSLLSSDTSDAIAWVSLTEQFVIPPTARSIRIVLEATSPVGASAANIAFDFVRFYFHHAERHKKNDQVVASGSNGTEWEESVGGYTFDNNIIWKGVASFVQYDEVASVTDQKMFTSVSIVGADGTYELGVIRWLSGNNAGIQNVIRTWDPVTRAMKLYFRTPYPIQVGDRFLYVRSCQKRFLEDCQGIFSNQINFRGFPHLPGRLTESK